MNWLVCSHHSYARVLWEFKNKNPKGNVYWCLMFKPSIERTGVMPCDIVWALPHLHSRHLRNQTPGQAKHCGYHEQFGIRRKSSLHRYRGFLCWNIRLHVSKMKMSECLLEWDKLWNKQHDQLALVAHQWPAHWHVHPLLLWFCKDRPSTQACS